MPGKVCVSTWVEPLVRDVFAQQAEERNLSVSAWVADRLTRACAKFRPVVPISHPVQDAPRVEPLPAPMLGKEQALALASLGWELDHLAGKSPSEIERIIAYLLRPP